MRASVSRKNILVKIVPGIFVWMGANSVCAQTLEQYHSLGIDADGDHGFLFNPAAPTDHSGRLDIAAAYANESQKLPVNDNGDREEQKQTLALAGLAWNMPAAQDVRVGIKGSYRFMRGRFENGDSATNNFRAITPRIAYLPNDWLSIGLAMRYISFSGAQLSDAEAAGGHSGYFSGWGSGLKMKGENARFGAYYYAPMRGKLKSGYESLLAAHAGVFGLEWSNLYSPTLRIGAVVRGGQPAANSADIKLAVLENEDLSANGLTLLLGAETNPMGPRRTRFSVGRVFPKTFGGRSEATDAHAHPEVIAKIGLIHMQERERELHMGFSTRVRQEKTFTTRVSSLALTADYALP